MWLGFVCPTIAEDHAVSSVSIVLLSNARAAGYGLVQNGKCPTYFQICVTKDKFHVQEVKLSLKQV